MLLLACSALTLAALIYVFWLAPEPVRLKSRAERDREYLEEKRAVLYENLRDLHLEYRMGKLSDTDYQQMKSRYQEELAALLDEFERQGALSLTVEPAGGEPLAPGRCPRCAKENPAENRFCGACGAQLLRSDGVV